MMPSVEMERTDAKSVGPSGRESTVFFHVRVYFVNNKMDLVFLAELHQPDDRLHGVASAQRIVWMTQKQCTNLDAAIVRVDKRAFVLCNASNAARILPIKRQGQFGRRLATEWR